MITTRTGKPLMVAINDRCESQRPQERISISSHGARPGRVAMFSPGRSTLPGNFKLIMKPKDLATKQRALLLEEEREGEKGTTSLRRCTWHKYEECRCQLNATWETTNTSRRNNNGKRETPETTAAAASEGGRITQRSSLIDEEGLASLTAQLWSDEFAGTIDLAYGLSKPKK